MPDSSFLPSEFRLQGAFGSDFLRLLGTSQTLVHDTEQRGGLDRLTDDQSKGVLEFSLLTRSLAVPTAYTLSPVFYDQDVPESLNYGTLGSLIAKEMSEVLAPGSPAITTDAATETSAEWWTEASRRSFNKTMQCWQRLANRTEVYGNGGGSSSNSTSATPEWGLLERSLFVWSRGARLAFDAMRRVAQRRALHLTRSVTAAQEQWQMQQRVFFARFCLLACSAASNGNGGKRGVLSPRLRCMLPLANMREFHAAYNCTGLNESSYCPSL
ncbi:hypothetical protein HPB49_015512 [Dermacentor silvarum]|uniref:Uncharacterized protein n=1 Tax=Dermacentor silvarum TaxID=543639 RepID=A0ACB8DDL9_DERSI|nr:hypothetical protein HPB49_015512 [Dermacentor silvarum]